MTHVTKEDIARDEATNNTYRIDVREYFESITGGEGVCRVARLSALVDTLNPDELRKLRLEECSDEKTGARYGQAKCRAGKCEKIGGGGRNKGSRYAYQVWAVWA